MTVLSPGYHNLHVSINKDSSAKNKWKTNPMQLKCRKRFHSNMWKH